MPKGSYNCPAELLMLLSVQASFLGGPYMNQNSSVLVSQARPRAFIAA